MFSVPYKVTDILISTSMTTYFLNLTGCIKEENKLSVFTFLQEVFEMATTFTKLQLSLREKGTRKRSKIPGAFLFHSQIFESDAPVGCTVYRH
jgi:hypothetical protein